ncbi:protein kinase [Vibrio hepatarius]|uniref:protein kinase domain-containing protein n=1 Tax=Vibrio hepatarius TaxID=171383 RepID=UPI00373631B6
MARITEEIDPTDGYELLFRALGLSQCSSLSQSVYKGHSQSHGWVCLKIAETSLAKAQLTSEIRFLSEHQSPYWPTYLASGNDASYDWLLLSFEEGVVLSTSGLELPEINSLLESLQNALNHLHSFGYIHGDIKPANILITHDRSIRLIDFGSVLPIGVNYTSFPHSSISPRFSAPNPHFRQGCTHAKDDFFSIAVSAQSLYQCHPFQMQSIISFCQQTSEPDTSALPARYQMLILQSITRAQRLLAKPPIQ